MIHRPAPHSARPTALLHAARLCAAALLAATAAGCDSSKAPPGGNTTAPSATTQAGAKAEEAKVGEVKAAEVKAAEVKPAEAKPAEAKPAEVKTEVKAEVKAEAPKEPEAKKDEPAKDNVKVSKEYWDTTGKLKFTYEMRKSSNGKWARNGIGRAYYDTGAIEREGPYKNNVRVGHWTYYDANGKVIRTEERGTDGKGGNDGEPPLP